MSPGATLLLLLSGRTDEPSNAEALVLLMQSLIIPGVKTDDGTLIQALGTPWKLIAKLLKDDPNVIFTIDPRKMEELIAAAYVEAGFDEVILTPQSGDFGRDVIAIKRGFVSVRVVDSVKAYKPGHLVKADDVRALLGVLSGDRNASKGVVTTTSDFAPKIKDDPFIKPFMPYRLDLINGTQLSERLSGLSR